MRKVNSDSASMNVYLWSLPPVSAPPSYHKILGAVKTETTTATSWGWGRIYGIVEMTKGKLLYCPAGILHNNDEAQLSRGHDATGFLFFRGPSVIFSNLLNTLCGEHLLQILFFDEGQISELV
jgi:hypothetical protein